MNIITVLISCVHFAAMTNTNEPLWEIWGRIVNDWDGVRKKLVYLRVCSCYDKFVTALAVSQWVTHHLVFPVVLLCALLLLLNLFLLSLQNYCVYMSPL